MAALRARNEEAEARCAAAMREAERLRAMVAAREADLAAGGFCGVVKGVGAARVTAGAAAPVATATKTLLLGGGGGLAPPTASIKRAAAAAGLKMA